jgi:hypothetical protein
VDFHGEVDEVVAAGFEVEDEAGGGGGHEA